MVPKVRKGNDWKCSCSNTPEQEGFYPCDEHGEVYDEVLDFSLEEFRKWTQKQKRHFFRCNHCGIIIDRDNFTVIGKASEYVTWDADEFFAQLERERQEQVK